MIEVTDYWTISEEYKDPQLEENPEDDSLQDLYLAIRAYEQFKAQNGSNPTSVDQLLPLCLKPVKSNHYLDLIIKEGPKQSPSINSIVGAMAAQEAVKLITLQYTPFNNTVVFDGVTSRSETCKY